MNTITFQQQLKYLLQQHLLIFHTWTWLSLIIGGVGVLLFKQRYWYFSLMTLTWGGVNLFLSLLLHFHIHRHKYINQSENQQLKIQFHVEKILFLNIGLDVGYLISGILFFVISEKQWQFIWHEFGYAILLQGVFLLSLDIFFSWKHYKNRTQHLLQD
jgi:hypothetical protein